LKHDRDGDRVDTLAFGDRRFGQEFVFAPRIGSRAEDDGYVVGFVHDEGNDQTECWVIDAQRFTDGPVARIRTPQRVPYGFHSHWVGSSA
jgi:carotenoid cleavage dioxygenase